MDIGEIKSLLGEIAKNDLNEGSDIYDHPCSVAIRALDGCLEDIGHLKDIILGRTIVNSKKSTVLVQMPYRPTY